MKKTFICLAGLAVVVMLASCRVNINKHREVVSFEADDVYCPEFERIEVNGNCEVLYVQTDSCRYKVAGADLDADDYQVVVEDKTLKVSFKDETKVTFGDIVPTVLVNSVDLTSVCLNGIATFTSDGRLDTDTLDVCLKGAGKITFDALVCDAMISRMEGAGEIEFNNVETQFASISLKGVGNTAVNFIRCKKANVALKGVGNIKLSGKVDELHKSVRGIGKIDSDELNQNR